MKKKLLSIVIITSMLFALCSCGGSSNTSPAAAASSAKSDTSAAAASSAKSEAPAAASSSAKSEAPAAEVSSAASEASAAETADIPEVSADGPTFKLKFASSENENTLRYQLIEKPVMDLITERTNGRITFDFFPSSTLAGPGSIIKGMQDGTVDMGMDNINSYPGVFLYSELLTYPGIYLGADHDEKTENIFEYSRKYAAQEYAANGAHQIMTAPSAGNVVLMTTFPVESVDSFNGKTICINGAITDMFNNSGAAITWTVPPEQYEAFHLNVIDGTVNGPAVLEGFKLYEVLDYAYYIPFAIVTQSMYISQKTYESLPEDLQAAIDAICLSEEVKEINKKYVEAMTKQVEEACATNPNFVFADLPDEVSEFMQQQCAAGIEEKIAELNAAGLDGDGAMELLNSFKK
ncbi:MAG: TRAP transporter substrate-binding protein DctP [Lachnospiraceae bacterium]|nr:TRAP transporter substrate-binding protein DctP [Lachnospiraceae bacterium]